MTACVEQHRAGDHEAAVSTADAALALWRGQAWQDLREVPVLEPDAARLEELRLDLRADRGPPHSSRWAATATRCPSWRAWCERTRSARTCAAT